MNVDIEPVRREVMRVMRRWEMGPEHAGAVINAVNRGLSPSRQHEHYWVDARDDETGWHCVTCGVTEYPGEGTEDEPSREWDAEQVQAMREALATPAASSGAAASPGDEELREAASEAAQYGSTLASLLTVLPGECQQVGDTCVVHNAEWSTRNGDDLGHCEWIEARTEIVPEWRSAEHALRAALDREAAR